MMCSPLQGSPSENSNSPALNSLRTVRAASICSSGGERLDSNAVFPRTSGKIGALSGHSEILAARDFGHCAGRMRLSDGSMNPQINTIDFNERPFIAIWEVTQACDLACVHCRASAQPDRASHGTQH